MVQFLAARDGSRCAYCDVPLTTDLVEHPAWTIVGGHCGCGDGHPVDPDEYDGDLRICRGCWASEPYMAPPAGTFVPQIEHVLPRSRGGTDDRSNLVLACGPCNLAKGSLTGDEYRARRDGTRDGRNDR